MYPSAAPTWLLKPFRDKDFSTALSSLYACNWGWTTLSLKIFSLMSNLKPLCHNLRPFPLVPLLLPGSRAWPPPGSTLLSGDVERQKVSPEPHSAQAEPLQLPQPLFCLRPFPSPIHFLDMPHHLSLFPELRGSKLGTQDEVLPVPRAERQWLSWACWKHCSLYRPGAICLLGLLRTPGLSASTPKPFSNFPSTLPQLEAAWGCCDPRAGLSTSCWTSSCWPQSIKTACKKTETPSMSFSLQHSKLSLQ